MQSARRVKSLGLFSLFVFAALPLAASAVAQPPVVRTKPVIDQQLQMNAAKQAKQHHAKSHTDDHGNRSNHQKRVEQTR